MNKKSSAKVLSLGLALGIVLTTASAHAQIISLNFNGWQAYNPVTGTAGVDPAPNWNTTPYVGGGENGSMTGLTDSGGFGTLVNVSWTGAGQSHAPITQDGGNYSLMWGEVLATNSTADQITVTNLNLDPIDFPNGYSVIVYTGSDNTYRTTNLSLTSGSYTSPSYSLYNATQFDGTFTEDTTPGTSEAADYVVFGSNADPLTGSSFTISYSSPFYSGITGFQIVAATPTEAPEPGTWSMVLLGIGGLAFARVIRRTNKLAAC